MDPVPRARGSSAYRARLSSAAGRPHWRRSGRVRRSRRGRQIGGLTNSEGLMHSRFALLPAVVATIATLLLVGPAAAATPWTVYSRSGSGAEAWTKSCVDSPDGTQSCQAANISAFSGTTRATGEPTRTGDEVCYSDFTSVWDPANGTAESHGVFGCASGIR